jgi:hypothetical protein
MLNDWMLLHNELGRMWKWSWPNLKYNPDIFLERLGKTFNIINKDSWNPGQQSDWAPPEYKSEMF